MTEPVSREMTVPDEVIAERLSVVRQAIADHGRSDTTIVAVTKGFDASIIRATKRLGLADIGENYAQEVVEKTPAFGADQTVHFMGRIQRNKVRKVCDVVGLWQSVARPEILSEIAKRVDDAKVLIQIQPDGDVSKDGVRPEELPAMFSLADDLGVTIVGLMTIGVLNDPAATRACFAEVAALADDYDVEVRSMGMSGDYRDALENGSNMLRLGSTLFGPRPS